MRRLLFASLLGIGFATVVTGPVARADDALAGVYFASSGTLSLHSDVTPDGAQDPAGYPDVGLSLRAGAKLFGAVVGGNVELAGMIDAPGARYLSLFAGYRTLLRSDLAVEITGEIGSHTFSNVGTAAGTYDVISETPASRPFWGARFTVLAPKGTSGWWVGLFGQVRVDIGTQQVTSDLRMYCHSLLPDGPACTDGETSTWTLDAGGRSVDLGVTVQRIF